MVIIGYSTEEEKTKIINDQNDKGMQLISIANITEGNFLGFDDRGFEEYIKQLETQLLISNNVI